MSDRYANKGKSLDRIVDNNIILSGNGTFPKKVLIFDTGKMLEYRILKTRQGRYQLVK